MSNKLIFVLLDGLRNDVALRQMGFMSHMVENNHCRLFKVQSEMPSNSRPLYETLLTGVSPFESGVTNNDYTKFSKEESLFHLTAGQGRRNSSASSAWIRELYFKEHFRPFDRFLKSETGPIHQGIFYFNDSYPDSHVFMDGEFLRTTYQPDFLFIHPVAIDHIGHEHGGTSLEYIMAAGEADDLLSLLIPKWLADGYQVLVTADHGMNDKGWHGGTTTEERSVPLFLFSDKDIPLPLDAPCPQTLIAPLACRLMEIEPSSRMKSLPF